MNFASMPAYPMAANTQYSPSSEAFPSPDTLDTYFTEPYATSPDYPFGNYYEDNNPYYCRATQSLETGPSWSPYMPTNPNSTQPPNTAKATTNAPINAWSELNPPNDAFTNLSPASMSSRYGSPSSLALSRDSLKHERPSSTSTSTHPDDQNPPQRKRGRPRLYRPASDPSATSPTHKANRPQCMPHTEVERKYREKLNMELERLRRAVPILPQSDAADVTGAAKPSKSMVLAVAIDYIKELERERDAAVEEVERLGGKVRFGKVKERRRDSGGA